MPGQQGLQGCPEAGTGVRTGAGTMAVGTGAGDTACTGAGNKTGAGTETGAGCVVVQQGELGWPVQHGGGLGGLSRPCRGNQFQTEAGWARGC